MVGHLYIDKGHTDIVRQLLSRDGIDANAAICRHHTPLYKACENGHTDIVSLLLSHAGTDVNIVSEYDRKTPIYIACDRGHTDIVRLLLSHDGIDLNAADRWHDCL